MPANEFCFLAAQRTRSFRSVRARTACFAPQATDRIGGNGRSIDPRFRGSGVFWLLVRARSGRLSESEPRRAAVRYHSSHDVSAHE